MDSNDSYLELLFQKLVSSYEGNQIVPEVIALNESCAGDALAVKTGLNSSNQAMQGLLVLEPHNIL